MCNIFNKIKNWFKKKEKQEEVTVYKGNGRSNYPVYSTSTPHRTGACLANKNVAPPKKKEEEEDNRKSYDGWNDTISYSGGFFSGSSYDAPSHSSHSSHDYGGGSGGGAGADSSWGDSSSDSGSGDSGGGDSGGGGGD